jgi:GT2 family glycosyltransferase
LDVSIIIVNYNTTYHLDKCINSILQNVKDIEYEIIVIDNNSNDRSIETLVVKYPETRFLFNKNNKGFGTACNKGVSSTNGEYIFLLNPDTALVSNLPLIFRNFLENNKNVGICSTLLYDSNNKLQYCFNDFPGLLWEIMEFSSLIANKKRERLNLKAGKIRNISEYMYIDWAIGACLFFRKDLFEKINGFDENFFLYYEDTDLQKRITNSGLKVSLLIQHKLLHSGKSSIVDSMDGDKIYYLNMHISKLKYYFKHHGGLYLFLVRIIYIIYVFSRIFILPFKIYSYNKMNRRITTLINILKIYLTPVKKFKLN